MSTSVLLVDDEPDMLRSLGRVLAVRGFEVDVANNGEEAVAKARESNPDAILMDIRMPGMSGLEACHQIRRFRNDAFVVLMTGYSELVEEAEAEGIRVMSKPVDPARICELMGQAG